MAGSACQVTSWSSDSSIWCKIVAGEGGPLSSNKAAAITLGNRITSAIRLLTYNIPTLSSVRVSNLVGRGDLPRSTVSLAGANFGIADRTLAARIGGTAHQRILWYSDTAIFAHASMGESGTKLISVTVLTSIGTVTEILSYNRPEIQTLYFTFSAFGIFFKFGIGNLPSKGTADPMGSTLFIIGRNFGSFDLSMESKVGFSRGEATVWLSSSFLSCKVSAGVFASRGQIVTGGVGVGTTTETFTIDAAKQFAISQKNGANTGSLVISVSGSNLATVGYSISERIGDSAAENSRWLSFTSLLCRTPSGSEDFQTLSRLSSKITVGQRVGTLSTMFTFNKVEAVNLVFGNAPSSGSTSLTLEGKQ